MKTYDPLNEGIGFAHGKIILIGEHAVVYGHDAIAWPLSTAQVKTTVRPSTSSTIRSALYEGPLNHAPDYIQSFVMSLKDALQLGDIDITITSELPLGAGLGSSAAIAGSITEACFSLSNQSLSLEDRLKWIHVFETSVHGNPSGVDGLMTSTHSPIVFNKTKGFQRIQTPMKGYLAIAHSLQFGSTKTAVAHVADHVQSEGKEIIDRLGQLVNQAKLFLTQGNLAGLGQLMSLAHQLFIQLGISHHQLNRMVDMALNAGALGAKLTGGGLGGCVIAIFQHEHEAEALRALWKAEGFDPGWILQLHHG